MRRLLAYGVLTVALTLGVVGNAWMQRRDFYPTCVALTRSSASLMVLLNAGLFLTIVGGRALQRLFFGPLRALEVEHLYERSWFAVTETCLAMTIFRDEFDVRFIIFFALLLLVKIFHWLAQDRVDYMEQSPNLSVPFHVRMISVISLLYFVDGFLLYYAAEYTMRRGPSMMIIFGFEYTILLSLMFSTSAKYILHSIDLRSENPWENKSIYIFYLDLVVDFFKLITYFLFFAIIVHYYGVPLHIVRDLYMTLRSFIQRCRDLVQYRRATANMNERYPNATAEELGATDRICIICREEMDLPAVAPAAAPAAAAPGGQQHQHQRAPSDPSTPKKLACGHIFHFRCLRSWLERQQSCPTCRRSVLENAPTAAAAAAAPPAAPAAAPMGAPVVLNPGAQQPIPINELLVQLNQHLLQQEQQQQPQQSAAHNGSGTLPLHPQPLAALGVNGEAAQNPAVPSLMGGASISSNDTALLGSLPLNMFTLTPLIPLPTLPNNVMPVLDHLDDEQLKALEGQTRSAVVERIKAVQGVQMQLTGIVTQLTQILQMFPENSAPSSGASQSSGGSSGAGDK